MSDRLRVAVWGTGDVGHYALRGVISHPDLELVGVRVATPSKVGTDAGAFIGWDAVGVAATDDDDEILAARPDCLVYAGRSRTWEPALTYLEAGVNVSYLGLTGLLHPPTLDEEIRGPIEKAALLGDASLCYGGIDPGFATQLLPLVLTAVSERIDLLTLYEVRDYDPLPPHQLDYFGFGHPDTTNASKFARGGLARTWGSSLHALADALGITLEGITEYHETTPAPETFTIPARMIEAGTIAAVRFGLIGHVSGEPRLRVEHVNRLRRDLVPEWRVQQGYGVEIDGEPCYRLHLDLWDRGGKQQRPALYGTAMYGVNAVPALCAAPPGIVSPLELPLFGCRNVGGRHQDDNWSISHRIDG
ncbi:MAG: diacylglycerol kinase [Actinobacteria bacterium]|nr:diacylglycerol kinase [Actinomycetota bacterium]